MSKYMCVLNATWILLEKTLCTGIERMTPLFQIDLSDII